MSVPEIRISGNDRFQDFISVRLPQDLIKRIDKDLDQRDIPLSRNNWLLEAAIEKLRKASSGGLHGAK